MIEVYSILHKKPTSSGGRPFGSESLRLEEVSRLTAAVHLFHSLAPPKAGQAHTEKLFAPYTKAKHFAFSPELKKSKAAFRRPKIFTSSGGRDRTYD
ncbi:MAG TPA: hypothetical protein VG694_00930, partial [Candidatus Paceibacterota bacterium]|nr:hypothetical protein [Candidatus Paceibacterota bacterium]